MRLARLPGATSLSVALFAMIVVAATLIAILGSKGLVGRGAHAHAQPLAHLAAHNGQITIAPQHPGQKFALGAVGLSVEADELATPDLSASHSSLVALMRLLGPGVLRVGGSSLDLSWWTSSSEPPPRWATSTVTPTDLLSLRDLLAATNWKAILGVNFGHFDPTRAADEARIAAHTLGTHLLGIEVGNEPDVYSRRQVGLRSGNYDASDYLAEIASYSSAINAAVPQTRLYGPDISSQAWLPAMTSGSPTPFAAITQHYYATTYSFASGPCKATTIPTALELLSPQVREQEDGTLQALVRAGAIAHRETRITETDATGSCDASGGPDTSPVFASALWALDWTLRAASSGVAGINFHGYFGRCRAYASSPICAPGYADETRGQVAARPEFYGLLAARQLEGGRFIPVQIAASDAETSLVGYATEHPDGIITLAIENIASSEPTHLLLRVPGYRAASSMRLSAPALSATHDVTFGHATIHANGSLLPRAGAVPKIHGSFRITLLPNTAAIVSLRR